VVAPLVFSAADFFGFFASLFDLICPFAISTSSCLGNETRLPLAKLLVMPRRYRTLWLRCKVDPTLRLRQARADFRACRTALQK
jgi:hypothetical protein